MNFFVLKTIDDKEVSVKNNINSIYPKLKVILPFEESFIALDSFKIQCYERLIPSYLVIKTFDLNKEQQKVLDTLPGSEKLSYSSSPNGPILIPEEDFEIYDKDYSVDQAISSLRSDLVVLAGPYKYKKCKLRSQKEDIFSVVIETKNSPEIKIPFWYLGRIVED